MCTLYNTSELASGNYFGLVCPVVLDSYITGGWTTGPATEDNAGSLANRITIKDLYIFQKNVH